MKHYVKRKNGGYKVIEVPDVVVAEEPKKPGRKKKEVVEVVKETFEEFPTIEEEEEV